MTFDISSIKDSQTADIELKDPVTGNLLGAVVTVAGPEHPKRKAIAFARARKARALFNTTGKMAMQDPAEEEQDAIELLSACTLGWSGIKNGNDDVQFTPAEAARLYSTDGLGWLVNQLISAMGERERFINSSALA